MGLEMNNKLLILQDTVDISQECLEHVFVSQDLDTLMLSVGY